MLQWKHQSFGTRYSIRFLLALLSLNTARWKIYPTMSCKEGCEGRLSSRPRLGRAREARASVHAERMEDIANRVESGELDPKRAQVSLQARQWLASRMDSKIWGDLQKVQADIKVQDVTEVYLDQLKDLMLHREPKVINPEDADEMHTDDEDISGGQQ